MKNIIFIIFLSISGVSLGFAQEQSEEPRKITIIHAGTLMAVAGEDTLSEQSIIVEDGKIIDVTASYVSEIDDADVTIVDLSDKFVMAGLMDMHVHLAMSRGPGKNAADAALAGVSNAYKTLMVGFTTVRDLGATDDTIFKLRKAINDGDVIGPRVLSAGSIIGVGGRSNGKECNGVESCRKTTRDMITGGADWIKIYSSCSGGQLCSNKDGAAMFFDDEIKAITDVAKKYDVKVAAHSHPTASAHQVLGYGVSSIEHGSFIDEAAMDIMIRDGVYYVPTVAVMDLLETVLEEGDRPAEMLAHDQSFYDNNPPNIFKAYQRGVKIATGTDAGVVPHGKNYREVERFVELGMTNADALKAGTINSADLIDKSDELGTIEVGKIADIIAVSGNPLTEIKDIENIVFVMKDGRVYKD
ncbi:MAG: amidohydrolase family protein [Kordiimonadaceae bacterium]|nr:amidohydrolase family protein [Kordiimonadaceae bacterium]MBT6329940.1 amidohydrolase family protein [Kordiimonadaceae bacterium]